MATNRPDHPDALESLSSLDDPLRRRIYQFVVDADAPVSREEAASATGIARTLSAYHLDKLANAGLLAVDYQRPPGRAGPGAGRPAKVYTRSAREVSVSVPPRDYELLARLLVSSIEQDTEGAVRSAVNKAAREAGRRAGRETGGDVVAALRDSGYLPHVDNEGCITLRNCPFHSVAKDHIEVVCALNLELVKGVLAGSGHKGGRAELAPEPGRCCVVVRRGARGRRQP